MASKKDLPGKKPVKGGRLGANENVTLVRASSLPKDLSARKPVKAGKKVR